MKTEVVLKSLEYASKMAEKESLMKTEVVLK